MVDKTVRAKKYKNFFAKYRIHITELFRRLGEIKHTSKFRRMQIRKWMKWEYMHFLKSLKIGD